MILRCSRKTNDTLSDYKGIRQYDRCRSSSSTGLACHTMFRVRIADEHVFFLLRFTPEVSWLNLRRQYPTLIRW